MNIDNPDWLHVEIDTIPCQPLITAVFWTEPLEGLPVVGYTFLSLN